MRRGKATNIAASVRAGAHFRTRTKRVSHHPRDTPRRLRCSGLAGPGRAGHGVACIYNGDTLDKEPPGGAMQTQIAKWGNSLAVRLPREIVQAAALSEGSSIEVVVEEGVVMLRP